MRRVLAAVDRGIDNQQMGELQRTRIALDPEAFSLTKWRTPGLHLSEIVKAAQPKPGDEVTFDEDKVNRNIGAWTDRFNQVVVAK